MKQSSVLIVLAALVGIGAYAVFAQYQQPQQPYSQPPQQQYQQPMGGGMMQGGRGRGMMQGGMGRGMMGGGMMMQQGAGPMGGPGCPGCGAMCGALAQESVTATTDGGVVVAVAGKLIKYDSGLKKMAETNVDVDWTQVHRRMQQIMQSCPMRQNTQSGQPAPQTQMSAPGPAQGPSQP